MSGNSNVQSLTDRLEFGKVGLGTEDESYLKRDWDFTSAPVIENLPSNAGDVGSVAALGTKIPHATRQPSPCPTTRES